MREKLEFPALGDADVLHQEEDVGDVLEVEPAGGEGHQVRDEAGPADVDDVEVNPVHLEGGPVVIQCRKREFLHPEVVYQAGDVEDDLRDEPGGVDDAEHRQIRVGGKADVDSPGVDQVVKTLLKEEPLS